MADLPVGNDTTLEQRRTKAQEDQAASMLRQAAAVERVALAETGGADPRRAEFVSILNSCLIGRVHAAAGAESADDYLAFASAVLDGIDAKFPPPVPTPPPAPVAVQ